MFHSKQPFARQLVLLASVAVLSGCWKPSKKDDPHNGKTANEATASFHITEVDGEAVTPRIENQVWKVAKEKEIFFKACVIDRKAMKEVSGHKFSVEIPEEGRRISGLTTTEKGCFLWSEKFAYNPLAVRPAYLSIRRRIHGEGVHVGFRDVFLEVNPWAGDRGIDRRAAVRFLKTGQVSQSHKVSADMAAAARSGALGGPAQLWMSDVFPNITLKDEQDDQLRAQIDKASRRCDVSGKSVQRVGTSRPLVSDSFEDRNCDKSQSPVERNGLVDESGALLEVILGMRPSIRVEGLDGNPERIPLKSGQFKVWAQLIASDVGEGRNKTLLLTPNLIPGDGQIIDEKLEVALHMGLSRRVTRGRLELAIKVVPVGLSIDVKPFEALYVLGEVDTILGGRRGFYSPKNYATGEGFSYDEYVKRANNFEEMRKTQEALKFTPFIYETALVMFAGIRPGETATTRTVEYKVQSCVRDTATGKRVQHQKFHVFDEKGNEILGVGPDGKKTALMTNQEGCLIWNSSLTHKYYKPEEFYFPKFKIVHPRAGEQHAQYKELVINPWDAMFRTFGFDRIEFAPEFIESVKNRQKIPSRLFIPRYSYHAIRFRYEIDRFMELEVKKQILLNLRPEVLRYSGIIGGRKVTEALRDGIYLMKVAIQKDYLDPADRGNILLPTKDRNGNLSTQLIRSRNSTPKHYVSVVKKLVRVNGGEINTPVEFSVQDLRLMRIRSQFLVQLEPVNEQLLEFARSMTAENKKKLEDLQATRKLSEAERYNIAMKNRARIEESLVKIQKKLATLPGGMIDVSRLRDMNPEELKEFDLTPELSAQVIESLKLNDFTVADAAPVVDLDKLVETYEESGLEKRTFVGPIIFLSNAYSDDLRPTDNLDERRCGTVADCDEFKFVQSLQRPDTNVYSNSKYYGSILHLDRKHVDNLIDDYKDNQLTYERIMPVMSSLANYAELYNLSLVSLKNQQIMRYTWPCKQPNSNCARPATDVQIEANTFVNQFSSKTGPFHGLQDHARAVLENRIARMHWPSKDMLREATYEDWMKLARTAVVPKYMAEKICRLAAVQLAASFDGYMAEMVKKDAHRDCWSAVASSRTTDPIFVDQKVRVQKTGDYVYLGGKQINYNVGANFGLSQSESFGVSASFGVEFFDFFGFPFLGAMVGKLNPYAKPLSFKLGMSRGAGRSQSNGTSIGESTYLVVQAANFDLKLSEYEYCTVVKVDPKVLTNAARMHQFALRDPAKRSRFLNDLHKGWMICTGVVDTKPLAVDESYYYFTQHFTEGDMLDQGDLYNHPWLLGMRGIRDFRTFTYLLREQEVNLYKPMTAVVEKPGWALDQMVDAYRRVIPTFPGLYTIIKDDRLKIKTYPFDGTPAQSFQEAN